MLAMVMESQGSPLKLKEIAKPVPNESQVLLKVLSCGVCRTDLHILDGELDKPKLPLIPGHQITGIIVSAGKKADKFKTGDVVGVPWLGYTCGECKYCLNGKENLCENALFTGYTIDGGFAEYTAADRKYCFMLPKDIDPMHTAPLLCAGLIGYRSYKFAGEKFTTLGIYGFGAAAHIIAQVAIAKGKRVFAFVKSGDMKAKQFALKIGCEWAGYSDEIPPEKLDAAIIFAPVGSLVPAALKVLDKGGTVVCGGIHMSDIPSFEYRNLWEERKIVSVANLTRNDGEEFFGLLKEIKIKTEINVYPLAETNRALDDLRSCKLNGSAVIKISEL